MSVFQKPSRAIGSPADMVHWEKSEARTQLLQFIKLVSEAIAGKPLDYKFEKGMTSEVVLRIISALSTISNLTDEHPPLKTAQRFGNKAFRSWSTAMEKCALSLMEQIIQGSTFKQDANTKATSDISCSCAAELAAYWMVSFGNSTRIDYGTGHEAAFAIWLCSLYKLQIVKRDDLTYIGLKVFPVYIQLIRKLMRLYGLEPAGSHGACTFSSWISNLLFFV